MGLRMFEVPNLLDKVENEIVSYVVRKTKTYKLNRITMLLLLMRITRAFMQLLVQSGDIKIEVLKAYAREIDKNAIESFKRYNPHE